MSSEMKNETPVETVERLASLARIAIPENKKASLAEEFGSVLTYIAQLDELTLSTSGTPVLPPVRNVFREDGNAHESGTWTESIVKAFPASSGNSLSVKKIITHE